jgi:threonine/homoserine/homoserine lactone efflux protein
LLSKPHLPGAEEAIAYRRAHLPALWVKGFLINTVNPFTFFFWIGISGVMVVQKELGSNEAFQFFASILGTIILTDFAKVVLAKSISHRFRPIHFLWLRRLSGAALVIFGLVMLIKVLWMK